MTTATLTAIVSIAMSRRRRILASGGLAVGSTVVVLVLPNGASLEYFLLDAFNADASGPVIFVVFALLL